MKATQFDTNAPPCYKGKCICCKEVQVKNSYTSAANRPALPSLTAPPHSGARGFYRSAVSAPMTLVFPGLGRLSQLQCGPR